MAKQPPKKSLPDPFDDEFDDLDVKSDSKSVEDPVVEDVNYDDLFEPVGLTGGSVTSEPVSAGQVVGGTFGVIIQAIILLVIFLAIGFGVVFAGQRVGVIPQRAASVSNAAIVAVVAAAATSVPVVPPTATPTLAPGEILNCPGAATWWNSQQVQDNFTYFTKTALSEAREANFVNGVMNNMGVRRGFIANFPAEPCVVESRDAMLRAFDATMAAVSAIGRDDQADAATQVANINAAYEELRQALALVGITVVMPTIA